MFKNYQATKKDFKAIEDGIKTVWQKELDFVFKEKSCIKNVALISFDSKFFYIFSPLKFSKLAPKLYHFDRYYVYKIPHKAKITEYDQMGWCANAFKWWNFLPRSLTKCKNIVYISGGLLTPFTRIHKKYLTQGYPDVYHTYESYLATIVHEFGHIYYNSQLLSIPNQKANLEYLKAALSLYKEKEVKKFPRIKIYRSFAFETWTEIFTFCAEYYAASLFWPKFKKDLDSYLKAKLTKLTQNLSLLTSRSPHDLAAVIGKILITNYPKNWPEKILQF